MSSNSSDSSKSIKTKSTFGETITGIASNITNTGSTFIKGTGNHLNKTINDYMNSGKPKDNVVQFIVIAIVLTILLVLAAWIINTLTLKNKNCHNIEKIYSSPPTISSIDQHNHIFSHSLRDYYVKTAYNCCCTGNFKNDFVDLCALENCIKQGARCLDFEIYSYNNLPVIAASSVNNFDIKETYNYVLFSDAMKRIGNLGFSDGYAPNAKDPLILHFRIMSNHKDIYDKMAYDLNDHLAQYLLDNNHSYENHGKNLGAISLKDLMGKIIIIVDKSNPLFEDTKLDEFVNQSSNSIFMRMLRYNHAKYTPDMQDLIKFNKQNMTIVLPDLNDNDTNPSSAIVMNYGCQFIAMSFQNFDKNMEYYSLFFDKKNSAFVLRPERFRFEQKYIKTPDPPPKDWSLEPRDLGKKIGQSIPGLGGVLNLKI
jgi:hypothetical protein